jgi:predicted Zn-dependent protease
VRALGEHLARRILQETSLLADPVLDAYLARLAGRVAAGCSIGPPARISVLRSSGLNAFSFPGGFLFLNSALLRQAGSEAELAAVLAHLLARAQSPGVSNPALASIPLIFIGGASGYAYSASDILAIPRGFVAAYRAQVYAADALAVDCLSRAGYDPSEFLPSLARLATSQAFGPTHPTPTERLLHAQSLIPAARVAAGPIVDTAEFHRMRDLAALDAGPRVPPPTLYR